MLPRSTVREDQDMRQVTRFASISLLIAGAAVAASSTFSARLGAQEPRAAANKKVLIFTYPGVGAPGSHGHASLPAAEEKTAEWGKTNGFDVTALKGYEPGVGKQDLSFFTPAYLNQFDGLIMMANGDIGLTQVQKKAIVDFVRSGKAFIGIHCATVMMYDFPEYGEMLGAYYFNSIFTPLLGNNVPLTQRRFGVLKVEDTTHPATRMLGSSWPVVEEFYTFATAPWSASAPELNVSSPGDFKAPMGFSRDRVHVLLSLDTEHTNLDGASPRARVRKGGDYPQSWWRYYGNGRVFYTSLGHLAETFNNDSVFRAHLTGGIRWALGLEN
jgi:type 1 glutamine amidotransferase